MAAAMDGWRASPSLVDGHPMTYTLQYYIPPRRPYSRRELLADRIVNFLGAGLSWPCAALLCARSWEAGDSQAKQLGFLLFSIGLVSMLNLSALYHYWSWDWKSSHKLLSLDHFGITAMIMGGYAPFMLRAECYKVLALVWLLGFVGFAQESCRLLSSEPGEGGPGRWSMPDVAHVVRYVSMGWAGIMVAGPLRQSLPTTAMAMGLVGGILYTGGICIFVTDKLEFHLAIWHFMVLVASACFYFANFIFLIGT